MLGVGLESQNFALSMEDSVMNFRQQHEMFIEKEWGAWWCGLNIRTWSLYWSEHHKTKLEFGYIRDWSIDGDAHIFMDEAKVMNNQCGKICLHQHCLQGAGIEGRYCGGLIKTYLGSDDICNGTPRLLICLVNYILAEVTNPVLPVGSEPFRH